MCNKCNSTNSSNFGRVLDIDVIVTGCGGECYGTPILPNMTLRQVLDIIVGNCDENPVATKWYWGEGVPQFPANDGDFYLQSTGEVWEYDKTAGWEDTGIDLSGGGSGSPGVWGQITGNITDQTDLITYINEQIANVPVANAGIGLSDNVDKIDLGKLFVPTFRVITFDSTDAFVYFGWPDTDTGVSYADPRLNIDKNSKTIGVTVPNPDLGDAMIQTSDVEGFTGMDGAAFIRYNYVSKSVQIEAEEQILIGAKSISTVNVENIYLNAVTGTSINGGNITLGNTSGSLVILADSSKMDARVDLDFTAIGKGVILRSPNNSKYRITVNDAGVLSAVLVP